MDFEAQYLSELRCWEREANCLVEGLAARTPKVKPLQASIEFMDATLFHILRITDRQARMEMLRSAVFELLMNRNVDHVPEYTRRLCDYVEVQDPDAVLSDVSRGRSFLFLGFHTGPYWTVFKKLIEKGVDVVTLFPPALAQKRDEIVEGITAMKAHYSSPSNLKLVSLDDPAFLVQLRSGLQPGTQLVVYLDGNSGGPIQRTPKRDVTLPFFHSEITAKTTIFRIAHMLNLPMVTFNAVRNGVKRRLILEPLAQRAKSFELVAEEAYGRLRARLAEVPAQWEGWVYFHNYFTEEFRASLEQAPGSTMDRDSRYFLLDMNGKDANGESRLVDKQTYKQYRVRQVGQAVSPAGVHA
jgi:predicted LPLAT superfamily acyltransferase